MQSDPAQLYNITAKRTGKSPDLYKEVGAFVFASLHDHLRRPASLITKLRGVGMWYMRKQRMRIILDLFPPNYDKTLEDFKCQLDLLTYENRTEIYEILTERMKEYEEYIKLRDEIRKERYKTQKPLEYIYKDEKD